MGTDITLILIVFAGIMFSMIKVRDSWITHLVVNIIYYSWYMYIRSLMDPAQNTGGEINPYIAKGLLLLVSTPFITLYDLFFLFYGWRKGLRGVVIVCILGLLPIVIFILRVVVAHNAR